MLSVGGGVGAYLLISVLKVKVWGYRGTADKWFYCYTIFLPEKGEFRKTEGNYFVSY